MLFSYTLQSRLIFFKQNNFNGVSVARKIKKIFQLGEGAIAVDLSGIVNVLSNTKSVKPKTFGDFCLNSVHPELMELASYCLRLDIVTDTYPKVLKLK